MSEWDNNRDEALRHAKSLARVSVVTRVVGILATVGAVFLLFAALDMSSRSDRTGFSIMSIAVILFGFVVWSVGAFHGAASRAIPALLERVDHLCALNAPSAELPSVLAPAVEAAPLAAEALPPPEAADPAAEAAASLEVEPAASAADQPQMPESEPEPEPALEAEIDKAPCPHCGGLIHPQATRCVHCMKKIQR